MPRLSRRKTLQTVCGFVSPTLAGCTDTTSTGETPSPTPTSSSTATATAVPETTTVETTNERAKDRALTAEKKHITEQLENASCVEDWGLGDYGGWGKEATVINQSTDGVYVTVRHPYWYGTEEVESDGGSEATYQVTDAEVQRLSGTNISPC